MRPPKVQPLLWNPSLETQPGPLRTPLTPKFLFRTVVLQRVMGPQTPRDQQPLRLFLEARSG